MVWSWIFQYMSQSLLVILVVDHCYVYSLGCPEDCPLLLLPFFYALATWGFSKIATRLLPNGKPKLGIQPYYGLIFILVLEWLIFLTRGQLISPLAIARHQAAPFLLHLLDYVIYHLIFFIGLIYGNVMQASEKPASLPKCCPNQGAPRVSKASLGGEKKAYPSYFKIVK